MPFYYCGWWCSNVAWSFISKFVTICVILRLGESSCRNPSLGFATKAKGSQGCEPKRVWEWKLTLPSELSFWKLESRGSPEPLESDCKGKTPCIEEFFTSLESYWSVDVYNGLTWPVWTSATQVMAKRKVGSQIGNLIPDHKKSRIDPTFVRANGVRYTVEKLSMRATTLIHTSSWSEV